MDYESASKLFSERLSQALKARKMTQVELSNKSGISTALVSRYMKGKIAPNLITLLKISEALEISPNALICAGEQEGLIDPLNMILTTIGKHKDKFTHSERLQIIAATLDYSDRQGGD